MKHQFYFNITKHKHFSLLSLLALVLFVNVSAQSVGDFRSMASASHNWNDTLSWQVWNGTAWVGASTIPGAAANANVTIADSDTINVNITPVNALDSLTIG